MAYEKEQIVLELFSGETVDEEVDFTYEDTFPVLVDDLNMLSAECHVKRDEYEDPICSFVTTDDSLLFEDGKIKFNKSNIVAAPGTYQGPISITQNDGNVWIPAVLVLKILGSV